MGANRTLIKERGGLRNGSMQHRGCARGRQPKFQRSESSRHGSCGCDCGLAHTYAAFADAGAGRQKVSGFCLKRAGTWRVPTEQGDFITSRFLAVRVRVGGTLFHLLLLPGHLLLSRKSEAGEAGVKFFPEEQLWLEEQQKKLCPASTGFRTRPGL